MATFNDMVFFLADIGLIDVLTPFLLVFTTAYAVLQKSMILGHIPGEGDDKPRPKSKFNLIVAMVMGFSVVIPHVMRVYPPAYDPVVIINTMLPRASVLLVTIICFGILVALWGIRWDLKEGGANWVIIFCVIAVTYIFITSSGYFNLGFPRWLSWLNNPGNVSLVVTMLVFFGLITLITREDKAPGKKWKDMDDPAKDAYMKNRFLARNFPSKK